MAPTDSSTDTRRLHRSHARSGLQRPPIFHWPALLTAAAILVCLFALAAASLLWSS